MRALLAFAILAASASEAFAVTTTSSVAKPTVLVVPLAGATKPIQDLGYSMAFRTLGVLHETSAYNLMHPKQLARALEQRSGFLGDVRTPEGLQKASIWLGAGWAVTGSLVQNGAKLSAKVLALQVSTGKTATADIAGGDAIAVSDQFSAKAIDLLAELGAPGAADARAGFDAAVKKASPLTRNGKALAEYGACIRILMQQPISIRDPVLLEKDLLEEGIAHCRAAASADPNFVDARAALGFAYALKGEQKEAEKYLASVKSSEAFLPDYAIGKFWVLNKFYDARLAVEWLDHVVEKNPSFLIARGYLGDSYNIMKRYDTALLVFRSYLDAVPEQPWVMSRIGYTYAKIQDYDAAIDWTQRALRVTPADSELLLELASRFVDAGRYDDARTVLLRVIADGNARGEVYLRLGYAHLLSGNLADAERELHAALRVATKQSEWRTRGRARYDLAKMWMRQGAPDLAIRQLEYALQEGFHDPAGMRADADLAALDQDPKFQKLLEGKIPAKKGWTLAPYLSPFPTNPLTGTIDYTGSMSERPTVDINF